MILTSLHPDEQACVCDICGGDALKQQLSLRGLSKGVRLRMINCSCGPVLININGSTLALGRGMARKITVERC